MTGIGVHRAVVGGGMYAWCPTEGQRNVLVEIGRGDTEVEVAERPFSSLVSAKTHASRILYQLAAPDRVRLVVIAHETGLVTPGS
jgi:DNA-binding NarL/FixJ family response regulator